MGSPMARLRRALVAVQAVLTTGCPCLGHLHCTDLHITAAGPTAWRVRGLPVYGLGPGPRTAPTPEEEESKDVGLDVDGNPGADADADTDAEDVWARQWLRWVSHLLHLFGYVCHCTGDAIVVGLPPAEGMNTATDTAAAASHLVREHMTRFARSLPRALLRVGDLVPAPVAVQTLRGHRRAFVQARLRTWLPAVKRCLAACLDEVLWGNTQGGPDGLLQALTVVLQRRCAFPRDVSCSLWRVDALRTAFGEDTCPWVLPWAQWSVGVGVAVRTVPVGVLRPEEPGLRYAAAERAMQDLRQWCRTNRCAVLSPDTSADAGTVLRLVLLPRE